MNYQAEINEYAALLDTPEAQAVLQAEEWPPLASVPVPPAFDPEWLPQVPRDMADAVTRLRKKRIPFGMPALCALGASSACACGRVTIQVNQGWNEASQLYLAGIAPPGAAKSPVMEAMTGRLIALQAEENRRSQIEIAREQAALSVLEAERAAFVKKKQRDEAADKAEEIERFKQTMRHPVSRFIEGNVTAEAVPQLMLENKGVSVIDDEGTLFDMVTGGRYFDIPDTSPFVKGYDARQPLTCHRKGASIVVERPAMSILTLVQPIIRENIMKDPRLIGNGFAARFLFADFCMGGELGAEEAVPDKVRRAYNDRLEALYKLPDCTMTLTPEAWAVLDAWDDELIGRGDVGGEWEAAENAGHLRKMKGTTARIAANIQLWKGGERIDADSMRCAVEIARYFVLNLLCMFGTQVTMTAGAKQALDLLLKNGGDLQRECEIKEALSRRKLFKRASGLYTASLDELEKGGYIRRVQKFPSGRPVRYIAVHPDLLARKEVIDL
ncbi:MAG: DUF3987 domain-containing protein [Clostridiales bacterium]|nr:DUF3987 domain-containing protein [Clostridiales bacterium]